MKSVLALVTLGMVLSACDGLVVIISTGPTPIQPGSAYINGGTIVIGTTAAATLTTHQSEVRYEVVAPRDGTLIVRVTWEPSRGPLEMRIGDTPFTCPNRIPPIIGRMPVRAGQLYRVRIMDGVPREPQAPDLPFEVLASLE